MCDRTLFAHFDDGQKFPERLDVTKMKNPAFAFGSKASTLAALANLITHGRVLDQCAFTVHDWRENADAVEKEIVRRFGCIPLIVRSSALSEDTGTSSNAGKYLSVGNAVGLTSVRDAIERVIKSYGSALDHDEVFVQPMLNCVRRSGVAMTRDPETGAPYTVINYSESSDTAAVTSGAGEVRTVIVHSGSQARLSSPVAAILPLLDELIEITNNDALDVEFAMDEAGVVLLQVRPMTTVKSSPAPRLHAAYILEQINSTLPTVSARKHNTFSVMSDWNPAEMIGIKPRSLAYSLYRELITRMNWASARFRYGYRDLRHRELMICLGGSPYIDVASSVESFIPAGVPADVAHRIVEHCSRYVSDHPALHDKLEFAVIPTCYVPHLNVDFSSYPHLADALSHIERKVYLDQLKSLTEQIVAPGSVFYRDLDLLPLHARKLARYKADQSDTAISFWQCISDASVVAETFSGLARAAFIATALLKDLEHADERLTGLTDQVTASVRTIGKQIADDYADLELHAFLEQHGHVRPGTYDVTIERYDEAPDRYFKRTEARKDPSSPIADVSQFISNITTQLRACELGFDAFQLITFAKAAIHAREQSKYVYAGLVSEALSRLTEWGAARGINRNCLSHLSLNDLRVAMESYGRDVDLLAKGRKNEDVWARDLSVRTPAVFNHSDNFFAFEISGTKPNYITSKTISAAPIVLTGSESTDADLNGKIVLIESADPGYDWIFTHPIDGFVTAFGGENSHMSIRAREFGIPAAIGVGPEVFRALARASNIILSCKDQRIHSA